MGKAIPLIFHQFFAAASSNYNCLIAGGENREALQIDPAHGSALGGQRLGTLRCQAPPQPRYQAGRPTVGEFMPLEAAFTNSGCDAVVLPEGLEGLGHY